MLAPRSGFSQTTTVRVPLALVGFAITAWFLSFAYLDLVYRLATSVAGAFAAGEKVRRPGAGW